MNLRRIFRTLAVLGPAVLVSVELFDPASIVTATAAGATFGFEVLWAALYSGLLLIGIQEISARALSCLCMLVGSEGASIFNSSHP